jgi:hypothetical protein
MMGLRLPGLSVLVLMAVAALCGLPLRAAWAHGLIVSYRGAQDQYVPCIFVADELDDLAPSGLKAELGCVGRNIVAKVKKDHHPIDFARQIEVGAPTDPYGVMLLAIDKGQVRKRLAVRNAEAIALLRRILAGFPDIQDGFEQRFVLALQPSAAGESEPGAGPAADMFGKRGPTLSEKQIKTLTRQAHNGDANAALQLAESGQFHPDSETTWWGIAAANGSPRAQYRYAMILGSMGGEINLREAIRWMEQAKNNHAEGADEALENLRRRLQTLTP